MLFGLFFVNDKNLNGLNTWQVQCSMHLFSLRRLIPTLPKATKRNFIAYRTKNIMEGNLCGIFINILRYSTYVKTINGSAK